MANYWQQLIPLPKKVLSHIESICRVFLWTGSDGMSIKAPISWEHICDSKNAGGLNIISLRDWNQATIGKLLWNIACKADKLWVLWVHTYYFKAQSYDEFQPGQSSSWLVRAIFKVRDSMRNNNAWCAAVQAGKYVTSAVYREIRGHKPSMPWRKLFFTPLARPRALFCFWMGCSGRLSTKDRLLRFGVGNDGECVFCKQPGNMEHLFFKCDVTCKIWTSVLKWLQINHVPQSWAAELIWLVQKCKGKSLRSRILNLAAVETFCHLDLQKWFVVCAKEC